jgi:transposase
VRECRNARHRLKALLQRNGIGYAGKSAWTAAHLRWLATLKLPHEAQQDGFQAYLHAVTEATARRGLVPALDRKKPYQRSSYSNSSPAA